jgi:hypothetical protein
VHRHVARRRSRLSDEPGFVSVVRQTHGTEQSSIYNRADD